MGARVLYGTDSAKLALVERNLSRQYEFIRNTVEEAGGIVGLTPELIKELHRLAMQDLYSCAGKFRAGRRSPRRSSGYPPGIESCGATYERAAPPDPPVPKKPSI